MNPSWSLVTAGQRVTVYDETGGYDRSLQHAAGLGGEVARGMVRPDVRIVLEANHRPFDHAGFSPITRGVWAGPGGETLLDSVGGSGFTQLWSVREAALTVRTRWTPTRAELTAARAQRQGFARLRAQVLLHYPALWWAIVRDLVPLRVSVVDIGGLVVLLGGPTGTGTSSLLARELFAGARGTCDNLGVSDGTVVHGLSEPLRLPADLPMPRHVPAQRGAAAAASGAVPGRVERAWLDRVPSLRPNMVVTLRRGNVETPAVVPLEAGLARRHLVAGTMCAAELHRFWPLTAVLCLGTGKGPALAPIQGVAEQLTATLPCFQLTLGVQHRVESGPMLRDLLPPALGSYSPAARP
ncbi:MAG TPA: hypothetical protein VFJ19_17505 [Nocardioidaceae bacterium]|nr:hypothetical protein [Nocardioidaceae bacterium]